MSVDQIIFFVLIMHEIALDTRLYVIVCFSYYPVIQNITVLVENAQYVSSSICYYFIFWRSRKRNISVSKRVDVSRPSIYIIHFFV